MFNFNPLFDEFINGSYSSNVKIKHGTKEGESDCRVLVELPGYSKQEVLIEVEDSFLNVRAQHTGEMPKTIQCLQLTKNADTDNIKAHMENGLLTIDISAKQKSTSKKISID